jgi:hypothetical protein
MAESELEAFLKSSSLAERIKADARIVIRRFRATPSRLQSAVASGRLELEAEPICELVVGERLIARGEIVQEKGESRFKVTEVVE